MEPIKTDPKPSASSIYASIHPTEETLQGIKAFMLLAGLGLSALLGYCSYAWIHVDPKPTYSGPPVKIISDEEAVTLYKQSITIHEKEGPEAARVFLEKEFRRSGHLRLMFGIAWNDFINLNYSESERKARFILMKVEDPALEASTAYLLGYLEIIKSDFPSAETHFARALEIRERRNEVNEQIKIYRALIDLELKRGDLNQADSYLNKIWLLPGNMNDYVKANVYHLQERIFLLKGRLDSAMESSRLTLELFNKMGHKPNAALKSLHLGYISALQGNFDEAEKWNKRGKELIVGVTEPLFSLQLQINEWLISPEKFHSEGRSEENLEELIRECRELDVQQRWRIAKKHTYESH